MGDDSSASQQQPEAQKQSDEQVLHEQMQLPPTLVISGPSSGIGKTTVAVGLMAVLARRGFVVQPYKVGPDFLDGMHHEVACNPKKGGDGEKHQRRHCVNLDDWLMGSSLAVQESFWRHSRGADICIVEGCMGLFDGRAGDEDTGSTAAISKILGSAPVVLVVDASKMARSIAAMVLGYAAFDANVSLAAVVANQIGSSNHLQWIQQAMTSSRSLIDQVTKQPIVLAGGLPRNKSIVIPERHLGLHMPNETNTDTTDAKHSWIMDPLADFIEANLNVDLLLEIAKRPNRDLSTMVNKSISNTTMIQTDSNTRCRIGIAQDEAFCFYYQDNLRLLEENGAELVPFSPLHSPRLPPFMDALYIGGGYPELFASKLQANIQMRHDILGHVQAGGLVFAECGGLMYLTDAIIVMDSGADSKAKSTAPPTSASQSSKMETATATTTSTSQQSFDMCGVFSNKVIRMTRHMKMFYAQLEFTSHHPFFPLGATCRGQKFHFSELVDMNSNDSTISKSSVLVHPQTPGAGAPLVSEGYVYQNTFASYYHLHFASNPSLAQHLVQKALQHAPHRKFQVVSFVSAATEIIFALEAQHVLGGVSSVCDAPAHAKNAPRVVISHSPSTALDNAGSLSSEQVTAEMERLKEKQRVGGPPGYWIIDKQALQTLSPSIAFVQNSCAICDPSEDDALTALQDEGFILTDNDDKDNENGNNSVKKCQIVQVSPTSLRDILKSIETVSQVLNVKDKGHELVAQLKQRLTRVESALRDKQNPKGPLRVLSLEGLAPPCTGGGWLPDIKTAAGCVDAFGEQGGAKPRIRSWEEILAANPDVLILAPCSAAPSRTFGELHLLACEKCFWKLDCVRYGNIYILDHARFSRPGPIIIEGIEMLATLLRGIPPPPNILEISAWKGQAYKYQCQVDGQQITHCTTELSGRFAPCFGELDDNKDTAHNEMAANNANQSNLRKCSVTRCTKPGSPMPSDRSAHNLVSVLDGRGKPALLLFGGEDKHAKRNSEVWLLRVSNGESWNKLPTMATDEISLDRPTWELMTCGKTADENVPTTRSNAAVAVCGKHLLLFGGWADDNTTPLSRCELLHLESFCWTHCSSRNTEPHPRGNPTLVYSERNHYAILFGGWDGQKRYNDLWCLDMNVWEWKQLAAPPNGVWPKPRTDHSAVLWSKSCSDEERMMVFGGSVDGLGPTSEFWALNCSSKDVKDWSWERINPASGPEPPSRTSHAMVMASEGSSASIIICGGNSNGSGKSSIVADAWAWRCDEKEWTQLDWSGSGIERCRQGMAAIDNTVVVWGGFDGNQTVNEDASCWAVLFDGPIVHQETKNGSETKDNPTVANNRHLQERWEAEIPMRLADLPADILEKAEQSKLPGAVHKALHRYAVANNRDTYIDPESGYSVFTQLYLKRQPCCGNGCRHCPWAHVNVPTKGAGALNAKDLEW